MWNWSNLDKIETEIVKTTPDFVSSFFLMSKKENDFVKQR